MNARTSKKIRKNVLMQAGTKKHWMIKKCNRIKKKLNKKILRLKTVFERSEKKGKTRPQLLEKAKRIHAKYMSKVDVIMGEYMKANGITKVNMIKKAKKLFLEQKAAPKQRKKKRLSGPSSQTPNFF